MAKYRGKYKKCRSCIHALDVHMVMVEVKGTCLKGVKFSSGLMVDKYTCERCEYYEEGIKDGKISSTSSK